MTEILYTPLSKYAAQLTINRPSVHNALNFETIARFSGAVERAHADPELRVLIVTGAGDRAFCSGGDLKELAHYMTEADGRKVSEGMMKALQRLEDLPVPTIAAINGLARGGGAEITLACDLRFMAAGATWGFTQVSLAVTPGWGSGQRLLRLVGYARAMDWLIEGRVLSAEEMLAAGVIQRVLPSPELLPVAQDVAHRIAGRPREVLKGIKKLLRAGITLPAEEADRVEAGVFPPLWAGEAHHAAVAQFLERRSDNGTNP